MRGKYLCVNGEDAKRLLAYSPLTPRDVKVWISPKIIIRIKNFFRFLLTIPYGMALAKKPSHATVPLMSTIWNKPADSAAAKPFYHSRRLRVYTLIFIPRRLSVRWVILRGGTEYVHKTKKDEIEQKRQAKQSFDVCKGDNLRAFFVFCTNIFILRTLSQMGRGKDPRVPGRTLKIIHHCPLSFIL